MSMRTYIMKAVNRFRQHHIDTMDIVRCDVGAMQSAGSFIMLYIAVFIGSIFGLSLLGNFVTFCTTASYSFNNSTYEAIFDIILLFVLPMLWVVLCLMGLAGASYGVWRIARRL